MTLLLLAGLAFLFPVATYCMFLAVLNAREHPTMVAGIWDFAGVLFATSGFTLGGGPLIIAIFHQAWGESLARGRMAGSASDLWSRNLLMWAGYFALVLGVAVYFLRRRRTYTVIYNIDPAIFEEAFHQVLASLQIQASRNGNHWMLLPAADAPVELRVDPFASLYNVTLRWSDSGALRQEVEAELARVFRDISIADNPAAGWFLTISSSLFGAIFLGLLAFMVFQLRR